MAVHRHIRIPLWDERGSEEVLRARRAQLSEREYNRAFRQCAVAEGDLVFKQEGLDRCRALGASHTVVERVDEGDYWNSFPRVAGVDLAIASEKRESAYFVVFIMAVTPDRHRFPLYMLRERLGFTGQVAAIRDLHDRFRCSMWMVETNAYQDALRQHLTATTVLPLKSVYTGRVQLHDLEVGLPSLATEFEHGYWHIPQGDAKSLRMMAPWLAELGAYPAAQFSDTVMASFFAREGVRTPAAPSMSIRVLGR